MVDGGGLSFTQMKTFAPHVGSKDDPRRLGAVAGESAGHLERVSRCCGLLAEELDLDPDLIRPASRLHDIGRPATPQAILTNPGRLTRSERATMAEHTQLGYALLTGSGDPLLDCAAIIAWTHHERIDGSGYPRGLRGDEIPLPGRIVAVADVFDALVSERPYRPALPFDDALVALHREPLDPEVVDALVRRVDEVREIMARFADSQREPSDEPAESVPLHVAAETIGVSTSRLRRWADNGRIRCTRTTGGHRRFPLSEVRRVARDRGTAVAVRPVGPPTVALPALAGLLDEHGERITSTVAASIYRTGPAGWFSDPGFAPTRNEWLQALSDAGRRGEYDAALETTEAMLTDARLHAVGLLERHQFLDQFGGAAVRAMMQGDAEKPELVAARRLFVALLQAHLSDS